MKGLGLVVIVLRASPPLMIAAEDSPAPHGSIAQRLEMPLDLMSARELARGNAARYPAYDDVRMHSRRSTVNRNSSGRTGRSPFEYFDYFWVRAGSDETPMRPLSRTKTRICNPGDPGENRPALSCGTPRPTTSHLTSTFTTTTRHLGFAPRRQR